MKFKDVSNVAMIGSGTMGAGMSWCFAQSGYNVKLHDVSPQQLERACARLETIQKLFVEEGLISAEAGSGCEKTDYPSHRLEESLDRRAVRARSRA